MLTEEKINLNYLNWIKRLEKYNCYSQQLIDNFGNKIKNAPFFMNGSFGGAYQGGMLDVVLNNLCVLAYNINENAYVKHLTLKVNIDMLMRVLLLQHISKAEMFVPQTSQWKLKNDFLYEFNTEMTTKLKCGEKSAFICMSNGISLSEEEYEAMCVIDKADEKGDYFYNPLSILTKCCNQIINVDLRYKILRNKKTEKIEE